MAVQTHLTWYLLLFIPFTWRCLLVVNFVTLLVTYYKIPFEVYLSSNIKITFKILHTLITFLQKYNPQRCSP